MEVIQNQLQALLFHSVSTNMLVLTVPLVNILKIKHRYNYQSILLIQVQVATFLHAHWFQHLEQVLYRVH